MNYRTFREICIAIYKSWVLFSSGRAPDWTSRYKWWKCYPCRFKLWKIIYRQKSMKIEVFHIVNDEYNWGIRLEFPFYIALCSHNPEVLNNNPKTKNTEYFVQASSVYTKRRLWSARDEKCFEWIHVNCRKSLLFL